MKISIPAFATSLVIAMVILPGCNSPTEETKQAKAQAALESAEYEAGVEKFENEAYRTISANEISIAKFEDGVEKLEIEDKSDFKKRIFALEKTNRDLKERLGNYSADGKENWEVFKTEFTRDLDKLNKALKEFTFTNEKPKT